MHYLFNFYLKSFISKKMGYHDNIAVHYHSIVPFSLFFGTTWVRFKIDIFYPITQKGSVFDRYASMYVHLLTHNF